MTVKLICVGRLKEKFYGDACAEFKKRISRFADVNIIEVSDERAPEQLSKAEMDQVKRAEGERILAKVAPGDYLIAMDLKGEQLSSPEMASRLQGIMNSGGSRIDFVIGGSLGLSPDVLQRADLRLCFGKPTFSHRLSTQLMACGLRPHPIATDNYFRNREDTPRDANGQYDFEGLGAMDVEQFNSDMSRLLKGETVDMPTFNFKKGVREYNGEKLTLGDGDVLVIEGIHCLNDEFSHSLPKESKYKIYISCLTTLNIDDHNRIPTTDARLLRRIERDARTRGYGAQATIKMWPSVRRGEEQNIFPYQDSADTVFNSSLIYETALLKPYVQPLLFGVPRGSDEYLEAKRLLKFLDYFLPVPADDVPQTSLMREFVGGGIYKT